MFIHRVERYIDRRASSRHHRLQSNYDKSSKSLARLYQFTNMPSQYLKRSLLALFLCVSRNSLFKATFLEIIDVRSASERGHDRLLILYLTGEGTSYLSTIRKANEEDENDRILSSYRIPSSNQK